MKTLKTNVDIDHFFEQVKKDPHPVLMLDYDGTLAPLVKERDRAFPFPGIKEKLLELMKTKTRVVVVSGRSLIEVEKLIGISKGLEIWGSHGLERKLTDGTREDEEFAEQTYEGIKEGVEATQGNVPNSCCEIKPFAVAVHWRDIELPKESIEYIENFWKEICKRHELEIHHFNAGMELRPKGRNKGDVIQRLIDESSGAVAFMGDDIADEEAFVALGDRGLKILVGMKSRKTLADIVLEPPKDVLQFLDRWIINSRGDHG